MGITVNTIKCPECGADLEYEEGREKMFCSFCGAQIVITNDNEKIFRHIDEAAIKREETDRMVRLKQEERAAYKQSSIEKRNNLKIKALIGLGIGTALCMLIGFVFDGGYAFDFLGWGGLLVIMMIFVNGGLHSEDNDDGKVGIPEAIKQYKKEDYQTIEREFRTAGFMKVECIPVEGAGLLKKADRVESITINGLDIDTLGDKTRFFPETEVKISYYSKK